MTQGMGAAALGAQDLALAALLVFVAGAVSLALRLELENKIAVASARTVIQLLVVGHLLEWVFRIDRGYVVVAVMLFMVAVASRAAVRRSERTYSGATLHAFLTLVLTASLTTFTVTHAIIGVSPWYRPQYVIPLLGMILGNSLTGISLCQDSLLEALAERTDRIEAELALGATRWEAVRDPLREAVRRGMIPIINAMSVVGLVSLPGMMTGQILEGASPVGAVKYQIIVMFMLAAATSLGCIVTAILTYQRLFSRRHQLLGDTISARQR